MLPLLWLVLFAALIVFLFFRFHSRSTLTPVSNAAAKDAHAEAVTPAAEDLRRRRAALLDRAEQTVPIAAPQPVKPLNLKSITEAPIAQPSRELVKKSAATPAAQPTPTPPAPLASPNPTNPVPKPAATPSSLETFLREVLRVTFKAPSSPLSASAAARSLLYLPAAAEELKHKDLATVEPAQIDALVAEAQTVINFAQRLTWIMNAFAQLERRGLPAEIVQMWRRSLAAQMAILLLESPAASSPRPKCVIFPAFFFFFFFTPLTRSLWSDITMSHFINAIMAAEAFPLSSEALALVVEQMSDKERVTVFSPVWQRLRNLMHRSSLSNSAFTAPLTVRIRSS